MPSLGSRPWLLCAGRFLASLISHSPPCRLYSKGAILGFKRCVHLLSCLSFVVYQLTLPPFLLLCRTRSQMNQQNHTTLIKIEGVNDKADVQFYLGKRIAYIYRVRPWRPSNIAVIFSTVRICAFRVDLEPNSRNVTCYSYL